MRIRAAAGKHILCDFGIFGRRAAEQIGFFAAFKAKLLGSDCVILYIFAAHLGNRGFTAGADFIQGIAAVNNKRIFNAELNKSLCNLFNIFLAENTEHHHLCRRRIS